MYIRILASYIYWQQHTRVISSRSNHLHIIHHVCCVVYYTYNINIFLIKKGFFFKVGRPGVNSGIPVVPESTQQFNQ